MAIRTTVSSNIDVSGLGMSSLSVGQHTNAGATSESAPVLMSVAADNIVTANEFAALVADGTPDLTSAFVARVLNALNETVQDIVDAATVAPNIDFGWGKFLFEIAGSVASASATPSPLVNYCFFTGMVASKYQLAFAQMNAYVDTSDNPCDLKRYRDADTAALNTINGTEKFYAEGRGFTWGTANDKQELYTLLGVKVCDLTLNTADSYENCLSLKIPASAAVPVGQYTARIDCAILGKVWRMEKRVNVITAVTPPAPTITEVCTSGKAGVVKGSAFHIVGTNLRYNTGDSVKAKYTVGGVQNEIALTPTTTTSTEMTFAASEVFASVADGTTLTFEVKCDGLAATGSAELLPRPAVVTNTHGPNRAANSIVGGDTIVIEGSGFSALSGENVSMLYETEGGPVPVTIPVADFTITPTQMTCSYTLSSDAKVGTQVELELSFANGNTATARSTVISA